MWDEEVSWYGRRPNEIRYYICLLADVSKSMWLSLLRVRKGKKKFFYISKLINGSLTSGRRFRMCKFHLPIVESVTLEAFLINFNQNRVRCRMCHKSSQLVYSILEYQTANIQTEMQFTKIYILYLMNLDEFQFPLSDVFETFPIFHHCLTTWNQSL